MEYTEAPIHALPAAPTASRGFSVPLTSSHISVGALVDEDRISGSSCPYAPRTVR